MNTSQLAYHSRPSFLSILTCAISVLAGAGCSDGGGTSSTEQARVYISSPDAEGRVTITGTQNVVPGKGSVIGKNLTRLATPTAALLSSEPACTEDLAVAHEDGSFYSMSLCASVGDSIQVSFRDGDSPATEVGTYGVPASTAETCQEGERAFTIANNSTEDIWLGVTAGTISCLSDSGCPTGASGLCKGANPAAGVAGTCGCSSDADCGTVSECNSNNKFCYWNLPAMGVGQMNLAKTKKTILCFPAPKSSLGIQWSGNMFARTHCDENGQNCATGDCKSSAKGPCPIGTGGNPPNTLLEFTLSNQATAGYGSDFYDVSIINGINLAASFGPTAGTFSATADDPYSCAIPGSTAAQGRLAACPWTVTPTVNSIDRTTLLLNVKATDYSKIGHCPDGSSPNSLGYCECSRESDCSSAHLTCGLALNAKKDEQYTKACGIPIGWWTANQICGSSINNVAPLVPFGAPLNCSDTVENYDKTTSSYTNFHICTKPADAKVPEQAQSCYSSGAVKDCCGCATSKDADHTNWPDVLSPAFGGSDNGCYANNPHWVDIAQPWIVFLKKACPTAYTYPFDDATSTFTCQGKVGTVGPPTYNVDFFDLK
ncbi:MAG: hypothetical protein J0M12_12295 [Deltaproteobacteria bacterium]|nr:hypothetical protein [Deltaproteobacteria bacterium]